MSIDSTRRRKGKAQQRQIAAIEPATVTVGAAAIPILDQRANESTVAALPEISERVWLASCIAILLVAAALRFYALEAIPVLATRLSFAKTKWLSLVLLGALVLGVGLYQSFVLSFRQYDNDDYPYVYAHTSRELHALVAEVDRLAARANRKDAGISVASPEYWPLPWYFRKNPRVGFTGTVATTYDANETPLVIGRESKDPAQDQSQTLQELLGAEYERVGSYTLRPGVSLVLFARRQLLQP